MATFVIASCLFAYLKPQQFSDLWLTRDQQGQVLFNLGHYQQASNTFKSTQWQAYSSYGAEQYKNAVTLYGQFTDIESQIAKANAFAHGREYINARNLYQQILTIDPQNLPAHTNIKIVQAIIDEVNRLSASQKAEDGEAIKELGDEPQTGDGAEREEAPKEPEIEQLTAEQLLLDANLNEMWLRQVQKNPANFLSQKFYMQQQMKNKQITETENKGGSKGDNDE
jgi:Ca-activated chloride channel family protein